MKFHHSICNISRIEQKEGNGKSEHEVLYKLHTSKIYLVKKSHLTYLPLCISILDNPKSVSFTWPVLEISILSGFKSLWTILCLCKILVWIYLVKVYMSFKISFKLVCCFNIILVYRMIGKMIYKLISVIRGNSQQFLPRYWPLKQTKYHM